MTHATGQAHPEETLDALLLFQDKQIKAMLILLAEERDFLKSRDHNSLARVSDDKSELAMRLQAIDERIAVHPALRDPDFKPQLKALKEMAMKCSQANTINGQIITALQQRQNAQSELLLRALGRSNRTYNSKGQASSRTRLLGDIQA